MTERTLGIIGGSGLYDFEGLSEMERIGVPTPFGDPSTEVVQGRLGDTRLLFIARHGHGHRLLPSEINNRANIWALKKLGAQWLVSVSAVGSMKEHIAPGHVVIPDQLFDRTWRRTTTFFGQGCAAHVSFADPFCHHLRTALHGAATRVGARAHDGGTYLCIEGPQFSTRGESRIYRSWGVDVIGMTNAPEAKLAREAELCHATLALATDYDCWYEHGEDVSVEGVLAVLRDNVALSRRILVELAGALPERDCPCGSALTGAIMTDPNRIPEETRRDLRLLIDRCLGR